MTVVDANVLLYAYDADVEQHVRAAAWLEGLFRSTEAIGLSWATLWAFLRVATNPRLRRLPASAEECFDRIGEWLSHPGVVVINPGPRHAEILERLVTKHRAVGPLVSDAVLAALAIENGATLASTDQDFSRFQDLRWVNPLS